MKSKQLFRNILALISFTFFIGCSSNSEENLPEAEEISRELLIGTWTRNDADMILNEDGTGESEVFVFNSGDNTLQFRPLTWRLDSNVLTVNFSVTGTSIFQIIEIDGQSMTLQDADGVRREYLKK